MAQTKPSLPALKSSRIGLGVTTVALVALASGSTGVLVSHATKQLGTHAPRVPVVAPPVASPTGAPPVLVDRAPGTLPPAPAVARPVVPPPPVVALGPPAVPVLGPVVQPPVVEPPAVEPPVVEPPAVEPPAVEPPVEEPPVVEPPVKEPPVVEPPVLDPHSSRRAQREVPEPTSPRRAAPHAVKAPHATPQHDDRRAAGGGPGTAPSGRDAHHHGGDNGKHVGQQKHEESAD